MQESVAQPSIKPQALSSQSTAPIQNLESPSRKINAEKIIGYFLLLLGLGIIFFSVWQVYLVFTGKQESPQVFSVESPSIPLPGVGSSLQLPEGFKLPEGFSLPTTNDGQDTQKVKLLPDELFNGMINMSLYFVLMIFVASTGSKIASLGIQMIKEIKLTIKDTKLKGIY